MNGSDAGRKRLTEASEDEWWLQAFTLKYCKAASVQAANEKEFDACSVSNLPFHSRTLVGWMVTVHELGVCAELQPMKIVKKFATGAGTVSGDIGLAQTLLDKNDSQLLDAGISELTIFDKEVGTELYGVMHTRVRRCKSA
jgi:hypothetical protein